MNEEYEFSGRNTNDKQQEDENKESKHIQWSPCQHSTETRYEPKRTCIDSSAGYENCGCFHDVGVEAVQQQ